MLFLELKKLTALLPSSIPEGTADNCLAQHSGNPHFKLEDGNDPWEFVNKPLNQLIGFGMTPKDITKFTLLLYGSDADINRTQGLPKVPLLDKGFGTPIIVIHFIQPPFAEKYY